MVVSDEDDCASLNLQLEMSDQDDSPTAVTQSDENPCTVVTQTESKDHRPEQPDVQFHFSDCSQYEKTKGWGNGEGKSGLDCAKKDSVVHRPSNVALSGDNCNEGYFDAQQACVVSPPEEQNRSWRNNSVEFIDITSPIKPSQKKQSSIEEIALNHGEEHKTDVTSSQESDETLNLQISQGSVQRDTEIIFLGEKSQVPDEDVEDIDDSDEVGSDPELIDLTEDEEDESDDLCTEIGNPPEEQLASETKRVKTMQNWEEAASCSDVTADQQREVKAIPCIVLDDSQPDL